MLEAPPKTCCSTVTPEITLITADPVHCLLLDFHTFIPTPGSVLQEIKKRLKRKENEDSYVITQPQGLKSYKSWVKKKKEKDGI